MIRGVGIDMVSIDEIEELCEGLDGSGDPLSDPFVTYTFTEREIESVRGYSRVYEALAGLFAVKEAAFKAVAHLLPEKFYEMRIVETLHRRDGYPYVNVTDELQEVLDRAGVTELLVSITNEGNYATAIVIAQTT